MNETWDYEVVLISQEGYTTSDEGVRIPVQSQRTKLLAKKKPVPGSEFYQAGQSGIEIVQLFVIHPFEYQGEVELEFEEKLYKIVRVYQLSNDEMELSCERKVGR